MCFLCVHGRYRHMFMCESNHACRCTHLHMRKPEESIICPTVSSSLCSFQAGSLTEIGASVLQLLLCIQQVKTRLLCLFPWVWGLKASMGIRIQTPYFILVKQVPLTIDPFTTLVPISAFLTLVTISYRHSKRYFCFSSHGLITFENSNFNHSCCPFFQCFFLINAAFPPIYSTKSIFCSITSYLMI